MTAVVVLALGMGATTAIFTLFDRLVLSPLPYPDASRLVWIRNVPPKAGAPLRGVFGDDLIEVGRQSRILEGVAGTFAGTWNVTGLGEPVRLAGVRVTSGFFQTLGIKPHLGRVFYPEEYRLGREMEVLFSYAFWQSRLAGNPNIVGRRVFMDGLPYEVVGVMPQGFALSDQDMWAPLPPESPFASGRGWRYMQAFARLKSGVTLQQAQSEMDGIAIDLASRIPKDRGYGLRLVTFLDQELGSIRQTLWIFAAAVGCVLLIACSNVASLMLARGATRLREMAVRSAVGATRGALVRQLLIESGMLAIAGAALGIPLALLGLRLLVALDAQALPRAREIQLDPQVIAFSFLLALATALIAGIAPALRASRVGLRNALIEGGRSGTGGRSANRLRSALVVIEVALGVVLLASAGLLARSFQRLSQVNPGYETSRVVTVQISLSDVRYRDLAKCAAFFQRVIAVLEQTPGVEGAGTTNFLPLGNVVQTAGVWLDSQALQSEETKIVTDNRVVSGGYFRTMAVPLVAGRLFEWTDRPDTTKVAIVNDVFAREYFPKGDALGKRITMDMLSYKLVLEIAGVVGSFRDSSLMEEPKRELFTAYTQTIVPTNSLVVRSSGTTADALHAIRAAIDGVDPDVAVYNVQTMKQQVDQSMSQPRLRGALLAIFSLVALILAALGVYGVIACSVAERKREIGIRLALGAQPSKVRAMVLGHGLKLTLLGLALGLAGAAAATRFIESFLFGVLANDPLTYAVTCALFIAVALLASYLPARRAMRVDPMTSLRED